jgi:FkbM family methyltransferase
MQNSLIFNFFCRIKLDFLTKIKSLQMRKSILRNHLSFNKYTGLILFIALKPSSQLNFFLSLYTKPKSKDFYRVMQHSKAQLFQDLFVIDALRYLRNGYYVEFGALDGITSSNTFMLEKEFGWNGILVEPSKHQYEKLKINRPKNSIDNRCVYRSSGDFVEFGESQSLGLSALTEYTTLDANNTSFQNYSAIETISLFDLLALYAAPRRINFLSMDTEGGEYEILRDFNFKYYEIDIIVVEHNYKIYRNYIYELLTKEGYVRVHSKLSRIDDWYIHSRLLSS